MSKKDYYQKNKEQIKEKAKAYYHSNKEKTLDNVRKYREANRDIIKEKGKEHYRRRLKNRLVNSARARSRSHGYEFDITEADFIIPAFCPLLGIPMVVNKKGSTKENSFSLDRIDSSKGYIKGNVWVISMLANSMKSSASFDQFQTMAENWKKWKDKHYDLSELPQREHGFCDEDKEETL